MENIIRGKDWVRRLLLNLLAHHPYGLSFWDLAKITNLSVETVKYNLKKLCDEGYVVKSGRKYLFRHEIFIKEGTIILNLNEGFLLFACPHFGINCKCTEADRNKCIYLKELPDILIKRFRNEKTK